MKIVQLSKADKTKTMDINTKVVYHMVVIIFVFERGNVIEFNDSINTW